MISLKKREEKKEKKRKNTLFFLCFLLTIFENEFFPDRFVVCCTLDKQPFFCDQG